jgi:hypothetical protein
MYVVVEAQRAGQHKIVYCESEKQGTILRITWGVHLSTLRGCIYLSIVPFFILIIIILYITINVTI